MIDDKDLSLPAASLSRAAPREWEEFKAAFQKYAERHRDDLVRASLDELQKSQGRAQSCSHLVSLFEDAPKVVDKRKP